jgi:hypothetical protein
MIPHFPLFTAKLFLFLSYSGGTTLSTRKQKEGMLEFYNDEKVTNVIRSL